MREVWLVVLIGSLNYGCGDDDDDARSRDQPDAARGADAASAPQEEQATDAGQSPDAAGDAAAKPLDPELVEKLEAVVDSYDREFEAQCTCLVANGMYASYEECLSFHKSGPDWVSCGGRVLTEHGDADTLAAIDCIAAGMAERAACVIAAECDADALNACAAQMPLLSCVPTNFDLLLKLLEECPDFGLLSRVAS